MLFELRSQQTFVYAIVSFNFDNLNRYFIFNGEIKVQRSYVTHLVIQIVFCDLI